MKKVLTCMSFLLVFALFLSPSKPSANVRGIGGVRVSASEGQSLYLYEDYHALIVGVSDYEKWPRPHAESDAKEIASKLEGLGFNVRLALNPTYREMRDLLNDLVYEIGSQEERAVLFYYAGHGETETLADKSRMGYIVPRDAPLLKQDPKGFSNHAISMRDIESICLRIKAKHVLMMFDSCFSGALFTLVRAVPADITEKTTLPVRQFITAGKEDEEVPDRSMFKRLFMIGLEGDADLTNDGYITGSELGMYLSDKVINYTRGSQHPQYGKINNPDLDRGDFVFVFPGARQKTVAKESRVMRSASEIPSEENNQGLVGIRTETQKEKAPQNKYESEVLTFYYDGKFDQALLAAELLGNELPDSSLSHLIRGNIYFKRGQLELAEASYQSAVQSSAGSSLQKAEALAGLGRIASIRKEPELGLDFYRKATEISPENKIGYLSQALLLEARGDLDEALALLLQAKQVAPNDRAVVALIGDIKNRLAAVRDRETQERIDQLVKELMENMKGPSRSFPPDDGWTSLPLTLWIMDFETQGNSLMEGENRLLLFGIVDQLLQDGYVKLVERALLEKLLHELKLGTSSLSDPSTALSLGKLLAARLILFGQLFYSHSLIQASLRLIETETGRITATAGEACHSSVQTSELADKLSKTLLKKMGELYPLRGIIMGATRETVQLNIGQEVGVREGQRFKIVDRDVVLEITSTQQSTSLAKIEKGKGSVKKGLRVEGLINKSES
jgi:tetratricopeptide (TPR) repeat protein